MGKRSINKCTALVLYSHYNPEVLPWEKVEEVEAEEMPFEETEIERREKELRKIFQGVDFGLGPGTLEINITGSFW